MITTYFAAVLCVLGLVVGQMLFKFGADELTKTGSFLDLKVGAILLSAIGIYGLTSLAWVLILQRAELGKIYPFMALAFVLVPISSHFMFGERFTNQYLLGVMLIVLGIFVTVRS